MNVIGEGSQLTYENFIYIALSATFGVQQQRDEGAEKGFTGGISDQELVLDVEGTKVMAKLT